MYGLGLVDVQNVSPDVDFANASLLSITLCESVVMRNGRDRLIVRMKLNFFKLSSSILYQATMKNASKNLIVAVVYDFNETVHF